jgi:DNA-binding transcriptional regulator YiaG
MAKTPPPDDWDDNPEWDETNSRPLNHGEMLSIARKRLDLSQQATADLLGIPVSTLRNWEQGRTQPEGPGRTLIRLLYEHPREIRGWLSAAE